MAKKWKQILEETGKVPPEQTARDEQEMLEELGMTMEEFTCSKEYLEVAKEMMDWRFSSPDIFQKK